MGWRIAVASSDEPLLSISQQVPSAETPPIADKLLRIVKRTDVDQHSERMSLNSSRGDWEDVASHHTVSAEGDREGGYVPEGRWSSSEYDTSGLSVAEVHKLKKKGINPALYAEMKAARKGKGKWIGPIAGNSYIG